VGDKSLEELKAADLLIEPVAAEFFSILKLAVPLRLGARVFSRQAL
jgi:hypothetical protein